MPSVRRLTAILAADVAAYSRLMGADEEGTHERLKAHLGELVNPKINEHRGRIVKNTGDGMLAEFPSVVDAVRCAVELQRGMAERNAAAPPERCIEFRIGINLGDVIAEEHDIFGDGVNVAARLEALAEPGGICVSRVVRDQVRDRLDYTFDDLGEQSVKNIARAVRVYRVRDRVTPVVAPSPASRQPLSLPDKPSLAVLPFQNMTGDGEQDYFVDGVVEEITTAISRLPWLFVIARNSSFTYKGQAVDVKQVARELGVRYLLEGSVRKAANRVRITGQLIDTTSNAHIWADRFDGPLDDIFDLQDRVASSVVGAIEPKLRLTEIERANRKPMQQLDAYDLYLRALGQFHKYTLEGTREALALLKRALAIDPFSAPAAGLICECRVVSAVNVWEPMSNEEIEQTLSLARQVIRWGKEDPDALWMASISLSIFAGEHLTAASAIDRALLLNPNSAQAWSARGWIACYQNQPLPAIEAFERAMRLSPLDPLGGYFTGGLALANLAAGRYQQAADWAARSLSELPRYTAAIRTKLVACVQLGRIEEARAWVQRLLDVNSRSTIAGWKTNAAKLLPPEILALYEDGLRKAGLQEE
jgi:TolB-like protein/class 3 adenylate cyclase/tetratricopeptide (TPR) repeat protein